MAISQMRLGESCGPGERRKANRTARTLCPQTEGSEGKQQKPLQDQFVCNDKKLHAEWFPIFYDPQTRVHDSFTTMQGGSLVQTVLRERALLTRYLQHLQYRDTKLLAGYHNY